VVDMCYDTKITYVLHSAAKIAFWVDNLPLM